MKKNNLESILKLKSNNTYKTYLLEDLVEIKGGKNLTKKECKNGGDYEVWGGGKNPKGSYNEYNTLKKHYNCVK
ncbi:MAG: hypothetical protein ACQBVK_02265 [Candidatus Phytoplasma sp. TWB_XP]